MSTKSDRGSTRAFLALLFSIQTGITGCASEPEPLAQSPVPSIPPASPQYESELFNETVRSFAASVELLKRVPPDQEYRGIRRTIDLLADSVEAIPGLPEPARYQAGQLMRSDWIVHSFRLVDEPRPSAAAKQALLTAAGAFDLAADGSYKGVAGLTASIQDFRQSVNILNPQRPLSEQRMFLVAAVGEATDVLRLLQQRLPAPAPVAGRARK